ncbi:MAG: hypothetical protein HN348_09530 [Proteobacteria bacterium]|nr:hypothetical protein [Pseudomonadota bacterium]
MRPGPYDDGHWEQIGDDFADYQLAGGQEAQGTYQGLVDEFRHKFVDLEHRSTSGADLDRLVNCLKLGSPPPVDMVGVAPLPQYLPGISDISRLVLDFEPAAGADGCALLLGPWVDVFDIGVPRERYALLVAVAEFCFTAAYGHVKTPFQRWCLHARPVPPVEARAAFRAIAKAPFSLWELKEQVSLNKWLVADLIGLVAAPLVVHLGTTACPFGPPRIGGALLGRIVASKEGLMALPSLSIPVAPAPEQVAPWIIEELLRARLSCRTLTLKQLLRLRGAVLGRRVMEWLWVKAREDLSPTTDSRHLLGTT